jgi:hypothetical protein
MRRLDSWLASRQLLASRLRSSPMLDLLGAKQPDRQFTPAEHTLAFGTAARAPRRFVPPLFVLPRRTPVAARSAAPGAGALSLPPWPSDVPAVDMPAAAMDETAPGVTDVVEDAAGEGLWQDLQAVAWTGPSGAPPQGPIPPMASTPPPQAAVPAPAEYIQEPAGPGGPPERGVGIPSAAPDQSFAPPPVQEPVEVSRSAGRMSVGPTEAAPATEPEPIARGDETALPEVQPAPYLEQSGPPPMPPEQRFDEVELRSPPSSEASQERVTPVAADANQVLGEPEARLSDDIAVGRTDPPPAVLATPSMPRLAPEVIARAREVDVPGHESARSSVGQPSPAEPEIVQQPHLHEAETSPPQVAAGDVPWPREVTAAALPVQAIASEVLQQHPEAAAETLWPHMAPTEVAQPRTALAAEIGQLPVAAGELALARAVVAETLPPNAAANEAPPPPPREVAEETVPQQAAATEASREYRALAAEIEQPPMAAGDVGPPREVSAEPVSQRPADGETPRSNLADAAAAAADLLPPAEDPGLPAAASLAGESAPLVSDGRLVAEVRMASPPRLRPRAPVEDTAATEAPSAAPEPPERVLTPLEWGEKLGLRTPSAADAAAVSANPPSAPGRGSQPTPPSQQPVPVQRTAVDAAPPQPRLQGAPAPSARPSPGPPPLPPGAFPPADVAAAVAEVPAPWSDMTRRVLRPLVGIDPAAVRVFSSPDMSRLAAVNQADAVTIGQDVVLGEGHAAHSTAPEDLGLLAHELTHVARRREPNFVPPIALTARDAGSPSSNTPAQPQDEETLARHVEARVARAVEVTDADRDVRRSPGELGELATRDLPEVTTATTEPAFNAPDATGTVPSPAYPATTPVSDADGTLPHPAAQYRRDAATWNGLPAPWEPLPDWLTQPNPAVEAGSYSRQPEPASINGHGTPSSYDSAATGIALAEKTRSLPQLAAPVESDEQSASPTAASAVSPDLDALAKQVYGLLKRRLSVEQRLRS